MVFVFSADDVFYKKTCVFQQKSLILHLNIEACYMCKIAALCAGFRYILNQLNYLTSYVIDNIIKTKN